MCRLREEESLGDAIHVIHAIMVWTRYLRCSLDAYPQRVRRERDGDARPGGDSGRRGRNGDQARRDDCGDDILGGGNDRACCRILSGGNNGARRCGDGAEHDG